MEQELKTVYEAQKIDLQILEHEKKLVTTPKKIEKIHSCLEGTACDQGLGTCHGGACCHGCWDGTRCFEGNIIGQCGKAGGSCNFCQNTECSVGVCDNGSCVQQPSKQLACSKGTCIGSWPTNISGYKKSQHVPGVLPSGS